MPLLLVIILRRRSATPAGPPAVDATIPTHFFGFVEALGSEPDPREAVVEAL